MTKPVESPMPDITYVTVPEVAAFLRVSRMTVYRWIRDGKLPATRAGRGYRIDRERALALVVAP